MRTLRILDKNTAPAPFERTPLIFLQKDSARVSYDDNRSWWLWSSRSPSWHHGPCRAGQTEALTLPHGLALSGFAR